MALHATSRLAAKRHVAKRDAASTRIMDSSVRYHSALMRYLEDFAVGQKFGSATLRVEEERVKRFAAEFDPQPFHLDDAAARATPFGGVAGRGRGHPPR